MEDCLTGKKIFFILYYMDDVICVSPKREDITLYLAQKKTWKLCNLFRVERCRKNMMGLYEDFRLHEHRTGYLFTPEELSQLDYEKERYEKMFVDTIELLKTLAEITEDEKEQKRLKKALKIVEKYKGTFVGKEAEKRIAESIATTHIENIYEERELYRLFYAQCHKNE